MGELSLENAVVKYKSKEVRYALDEYFDIQSSRHGISIEMPDINLELSNYNLEKAFEKIDIAIDLVSAIFDIDSSSSAISHGSSATKDLSKKKRKGKKGDDEQRGVRY